MMWHFPSPVQAARSSNPECLSMDVRKVILRTASMLLSSIGLLLSLLAIFIRTLVPSAFLSPKPPPEAAGNTSRPIARRLKRSISISLTSSSPQSTKSNSIMHSSMVVPRRHTFVDELAPPVPAKESHTQRSNPIRVSEAHKIRKRHTFSVSLSSDACRIIASPKQTTLRLKGRNSIGSFCRPLKNPNHTSDPPLRTQPYAAPYFFPAPGTPEAIDYVTKTREELRPSGFTHDFICKRNKRSSEG